jgi:hypothetical protein
VIVPNDPLWSQMMMMMMMLFTALQVLHSAITFVGCRISWKNLLLYVFGDFVWVA